MQRGMTSHWHLSNLSVSILVLGLLLWFTFVFFVRVPYAGFYFNPTNGEVVDVYVETGSTGLLRNGDIIRRIGDTSWERYRSDATQSFFDGFRKGQYVSISILRNEQALEILWPYPGFTVAEFKARLFNIWLLGYIFWFFGFLTQLLIRPRNARWRLLITANYLTGLWLVCGTLSGSHVGQSALVLRAVTWLMLPVYLNLHWDFPKPLLRLPKPIWNALYIVAFALAGMEFLQLLPRSLYSLGFVITLSGSLMLLFAHFGFQPTQRRDVGLLLIAFLIAVIPSLVLGFLYTLRIVPETGAMSLLILPIMPAAYFFVIYRRKLGGLELRANRIISMYSYLILLGTVLLLLALPVSTLAASPQTLILLIVIVALVVALISILVFPRYQSFVEQRLLGIRLPYQGLQEAYSDRITTSTSVTSLAKLLDNEVFPSLLVRQFAFFQISRDSLRTLLTRGLAEEQLPNNDDLPYLVAQAGKYLPESSNSELPWIRLVLPLRIDGDLIGLWLFGNRDPDDVYAQSEIPILQALANQTAIALSNIHQTEQLRILYKENINRHEQERMRLALELHDGVLNRMAVLSLNLDPASVSPRFREAYDELTKQLREIVGSLRPPMLQYGLKPACEELSYTLMERGNGGVKIVADIHAGEDRYPEDIELHIFRILQEASENALQHGHPTTIKIDVRLEPNMIALAIEDDGIGFEMGDQPDLEELLANKHFGLAGMVERCRLIGAEMRINSALQKGVQLHINWNRTMNS